jgi:hypothetical protein
VHTTEGELCVCTNEMNQTCIYTNLGACLGPTSYFLSSNLLYYFYGSTSCPENYISTLIISCGPTSILWSSISLYSFPGCSSTVQWSSFDFLESSSSLRKVVQEGIPPTATKTSTLRFPAGISNYRSTGPFRKLPCANNTRHELHLSQATTTL